MNQEQKKHYKVIDQIKLSVFPELLVKLFCPFFGKRCDITLTDYRIY